MQGPTICWLNIKLFTYDPSWNWQIVPIQPYRWQINNWLNGESSETPAKLPFVSVLWWSPSSSKLLLIWLISMTISKDSHQLMRGWSVETTPLSSDDAFGHPSNNMYTHLFEFLMIFMMMTISKDSHQHIRGWWVETTPQMMQKSPTISYFPPFASLHHPFSVSDSQSQHSVSDFWSLI